MPFSIGNITDTLRSYPPAAPPQATNISYTGVGLPASDDELYVYRGLGTTNYIDMMGHDYSNITYLSSTIIRKLVEIRDILGSFDINTITLAGGAPRDLYMNALLPLHANNVKDFDFFLNCQLTDISIELLRDMGFTHLQVQSNEDYEGADEDQNPNWVAKGLYAGLDINFIVYTNVISSEDIIKNFGCSLSKFEFDLNTLKITASREARLSMVSKMLVFNDNVSDNYKAKICSYFPEFTVGTYQEAAMSIVNREVRSLIETL